jgi:lipopolysaccharide export system protein LptA
MGSKLQTSPSTSPAARVHGYVGLRARRRLFGALLLAGLVLGVLVVIVAYRSRPRSQAPAEAPQPLPEDAERSAAGYTFTRSEHDHPVFTIHAQRSLDLKNGAGTILEGVEVESFGRSGDQHDLLQTQRCQYQPDSGDFFCAGRVEIELDAPPGSKIPESTSSAPRALARGRQPVHLETSALSYNQKKSLATTLARVQWRYGDASGSAIGLIYDTREGRLEFQHDVAATLPVAASADDAKPEGPLYLTGAGLRYVRGQVELSGPVQIREGDRQVTAGHAIAHLDKRNKITSALLEDGVHASDPSQGSVLTAQADAMQAEFDPASGDLKLIQANGHASVESKRDSGSGSSRLEADRFVTSFVGAHFHPDHGIASGNVHLSSDAVRQNPGKGTPAIASPNSLAREDLRASEIQFDFRPQDGTLKEAHTTGPGKLLLVPSSSKADNREVTAGRFDMAFDARSRLESVHGSAPTRIVFQPAPGASAKRVPMESRAQDLQAELDPVSGALQFIQQSGQFQFLDGDERARADRAQFSQDTDTLKLEGKPELTDPQNRIQADHVVLHLSTNMAEGSGHVSSTRLGDALSDAAGSRPEAAPGASSLATNVLADRVSADRDRGLLHYEGHVRAWHGSDVVESPVIDIYRGERRIVAGTPVLTSDLAPATTTGAEKASGTSRKGDVHAVSAARQPGSAVEPIVIRADHLEYLDAESRAAYRGHVRMDASGATLTSDRLDAYFVRQASGTSTLDHAVAEGSVIVVEPGRRAAGDRADYDATAGKVVLTGNPPTLYDSEKGFVTGRVLTFFTEGDSLLVDGGDGYRTLSQHRSTK